MTQERVINIGNNNTISAPVVIADRIENSFTTLAKSEVGSDIQELIEQLIKQVNEVSKTCKVAHADSMARDVESLTKEVASKSPRREWYELSVKGLKEAATAIGEVGKPILETLQKLAPLVSAFL